ncbi:hypothetical protein GXB81_25620 [Paraburkholderia sp. Ac-20336]|uniref:hypothetical protein n=1 Tax=Burkholderiaceae TaxID=119060 RepID=UPI00142238E5|nr:MULTISPECIES: hypothetical protein [Burkholderiaceae]MBN3806406.1 hypothetical protein [Paraburkholderia sp. Ac-20336]MBN3851066.1 hypothetical protein [Paraburkholderia sp. Ac-20342]NIF53002.1 hypothetical protein [Burkholderia sp. Ax-1724]NIF76284.1 hypothetical protein [Paraburkholderia sp. Cy-641]
MKRFISNAILANAVLCCAAAYAQTPPHNVGDRHPNLRAAQHLVDQANRRIDDAQRANEWDLGGHAQRARDLLVQANEELKQAAETANTEHR